MHLDKYQQGYSLQPHYSYPPPLFLLPMTSLLSSFALRSVRKISGKIPTQSAVLTLVVIQWRTPHKLLGSPIKLARPDMDQTLRFSNGDSSPNIFFVAPPLACPDQPTLLLSWKLPGRLCLRFAFFSPHHPPEYILTHGQ